MKKQLLILCGLLLGIMSYAQTTLVNFPFTNIPAGNGLNYDVVDPSYDGSTLPFPNLIYGPSAVKYFNNNMLEFDKTSDYLTLSINTVGKSGLIASFDGVADLGFGSYWADIYIEANTGPGSSFVQIGDAISVNGKKNNYSVILPTAAIKSDLKIRLKYSLGWWGSDIVRIDNLKIVTGAPKIKVYTDGNVHIPHLSPASVALTTDFGVLENTASAVTRTFKVRNFEGSTSSKLKVSDIVITGANPEDFSVNVTSLGDIDPTTSDTDNNTARQKSFTVSFKPLADGVRTAEIRLYSNSAPSPYVFTVLGTGASCKLVPGTNVINTIDAGQQTLAGDYTGTDIIVGKSAADSNSLTERLYPGGENLYISSPSSWYTRDGSKTVTFGGKDGVNISKLKSVSIVFNVAAFSNEKGGGVNQNSYITLSVMKPDGLTWSDEMKLEGSGNDGNYQYGFGSTDTFARTFNGVLKEDNNRSYGFLNLYNYKFGKFVLNIPASSGIQNLKFKITTYTPNIKSLWLIDDVRIETQTAESRTWDGSTWVGGTPDINKKAFIDGHYLASRPSFDACECEVNPGKSVVIDSGKIVKLRGNLINNGTFTMKSGGNLLQLEADAQNTGDITVERHVSAMNNISTKMDYVYWSSPVEGQNLQAFSPKTPPANILQYKESTDFFVTSYDGVFKPGKGYAIRAEGSPLENGYNKDYQFVGKPHNGDYKVGITRSPDTNGNVHGYNLIGNPYPSNIKFDELFDNNKDKDNNSIIYSTAWFWTNNVFTASQQGSGYSGNNYAVYNKTGGNNAPVPKNTSYSNIKPNGFVKVGQGFLVQKINLGSDTLIFKNSYGASKDLRVPNSGTFYQKNTAAKNRFWLKLISPDDMVNTQLIGYIEGATDVFEMNYDAEAFGLSSNLFYSLLDNKRLVIQGKANQFTNEDRVNLGANFFKNGNYIIEVEQPEGIFTNGQTIYLKDKLTGTITNLSQGSYTFEANKGVTEGRFEIIYKPETVLVTDSKVKDGIVVYRDSDNFVVQAPKIIANVEVYDLSGKLITVLKANTNQAVLNASFFNKGMYVLRIKTIDGEITNKKIMK